VKFCVEGEGDQHKESEEVILGGKSFIMVLALHVSTELSLDIPPLLAMKDQQIEYIETTIKNRKLVEKDGLPGEHKVGDVVYSLITRNKKVTKFRMKKHITTTAAPTVDDRSENNCNSGGGFDDSIAKKAAANNEADIEMMPIASSSNYVVAGRVVSPATTTTTSLDAIDIATSSEVSPSPTTPPASAAAADLVAPVAPVFEVVRGDKGKVIGKCPPLSTLRLKVSILFS